MEWRFRTVHLEVNKAQTLWDTARDLVRTEVAAEVKLLEAALETFSY
jgi:hypothetical protein